LIHKAKLKTIILKSKKKKKKKKATYDKFDATAVTGPSKTSVVILLKTPYCHEMDINDRKNTNLVKNILSFILFFFLQSMLIET
jgi:hypothetical protein